jgi:hypothetical protein
MPKNMPGSAAGNMTRAGHFTQGALSGRPSESSSLQQSAQRFNEQVPGKFQANGLNQPFMLSSGNGNSASDAARQTPNGELPSPNGMSASTYSQINPSAYGMSLRI